MSTNSASSTSSRRTAGAAAMATGTLASTATRDLAAHAAATLGWVATMEAAEPLSRSIERLQEEQARLRADRKQVAQELKNASKRKSRLRKRARQLSNDDLVAVLLMRQTAEDEAESSPAEPIAADAPEDNLGSRGRSASEVQE